MKTITKMLAIGLFTLIDFGIASCSKTQLTQNEIVKNNAEEYIKSKLNDLESYEFVKLELVDSVLFMDNIKFRKDNFTKQIEDDQSSLERQNEYKAELPEMYDIKEVENLKMRIEKNKVILYKIDSLETQMGSRKNEVASYTYIFSFRGNNALGVKVLNEYVIQTDSSTNFKIINMTDDKKKIFLNPNDFPGYREMIEKNL